MPHWSFFCRHTFRSATAASGSTLTSFPDKSTTDDARRISERATAMDVAGRTAMAPSKWAPSPVPRESKASDSTAVRSLDEVSDPLSQTPLIPFNKSGDNARLRCGRTPA